MGNTRDWGVALMPAPVRESRLDPCCPWCGSEFTSAGWGPNVAWGSKRRYQCSRCFRVFDNVPEVEFDVITETWTPPLGALQRAGECIAVRLAGGTYGICLIVVESPRGRYIT